LSSTECVESRNFINTVPSQTDAWFACTNGYRRTPLRTIHKPLNDTHTQEKNQLWGAWKGSEVAQGFLLVVGVNRCKNSRPSSKLTKKRQKVGLKVRTSAMAPVRPLGFGWKKKKVAGSKNGAWAANLEYAQNQTPKPQKKLTTFDPPPQMYLGDPPLQEN